MARDVKQLKFGVNIHTSIQPGVDPVTEARHAEQLGFDFDTLVLELLGSAKLPCRSAPLLEKWCQEDTSGRDA